MLRSSLLVGALLCLCPAAAHGRTVYVCRQEGVVSVATAPEPGSKCQPKSFEEGPRAPPIWAEAGIGDGTLYERTQDGKVVYSTRKLPGSTAVMTFHVKPLLGRSISEKPSKTSKPRLGVFDTDFRSASKKYKVDEALLRAVAQIESDFNPIAVSPKGAMGVMQLMPETASLYSVDRPFLPYQSIHAGARHLAYLLRLYKGDQALAAAAYNAGIESVRQYKGIPPYRETIFYVAKVSQLAQEYTLLISKHRGR